MQLIHPDGRRLNEVQLSPEVRIVAATNRPKDGAGVRGLLTPVLSRFHSILSIVPDLDSWCQWAFNAGVDPLIPGFLLYTRDEGPIRSAEEGSLFYTPHPPMEMKAFPCPRTWAHAGQILKAMGDDARDGDLFPLLAGAIGEAATAAFLSFRATHRDLPDLADIVAEPDAAPLPSDPAITYLTLTAICRQLDRGTAEPFVQYVRRLAQGDDGPLPDGAARRQEGLRPRSPSWWPTPRPPSLDRNSIHTHQTSQIHRRYDMTTQPATTTSAFTPTTLPPAAPPNGRPSASGVPWYTDEELEQRSQETRATQAETEPEAPGSTPPAHAAGPPPDQRLDRGPDRPGRHAHGRGDRRGRERSRRQVPQDADPFEGATPHQANPGPSPPARLSMDPALGRPRATPCGDGAPAEA